MSSKLSKVSTTTSWKVSQEELLRNVILMKSFPQVLETEPRIHFKIAISTEEFIETQDGLSCELLFTLPIKYPDEAPLLEIENDNFEDGLLNQKLIDSLNTMVEENLGTEMIFTLVAGAQELLNTLFDEMKISREEAKLKKEQEIEEAERKRFEGTIVSVDNSRCWLMLTTSLSRRSQSKRS